jgi:ketosteroid isomerase-like protein
VAAHDEFSALDEFRAEWLVHCYRMLGLAGESEDVAQETYLRALLDRFAAAFEDGDVTALAALLREDVALELPPLATWFSGRETVLGYLASNLCTTAGRIRLRPAAANGQPAFAAYRGAADGVYRAHAMIVLTLTGALITRIVVFLEPALFRLFGLDRELAPGQSGDGGRPPGGSDRGPPLEKFSSRGVFSSPCRGLDSLLWCLRRRHVHAILACVLARPTISSPLA